ncbi:response regulator receiver protein [Crinalium epipsammum PCC 9333]|uniref:Response regulator receiver protein n=1 Tax=Crinalium epipsammum PCC 9333 TaxID=1173022 RepID=K9VVZ5_9CYAN|nr:response regulator receiver protein [Crinalium epipsammum PCC 9333]
MMIADNTILLVEDDPNDILLIQRAFFYKANVKNSVQVLKDGEEALLYLSGKQMYADRDRYPLPILILLDLKLPRKSGFEVLTWLRQQPGLKLLPVVVLTSSSENNEIQQAYNLGANSYLVKPVGFDALLEMIKQINLYWLGLNKKPIVNPD